MAQPQGEVGAEIGVDEEHDPDRRDDIPDGPPGHLEREEDDPPAEDGIDRADPATHPFGESGVLDDVVDDDYRHDEHEEEIKHARPALGRSCSEFEEREADDEGPQEVEAHMGLLGDEPEEGGVEKIGTVDGAEGLQGGIVPPLQFSFSPSFAEQSLILQILDDVPEDAHSDSPVVRLPPVSDDGCGCARPSMPGLDCARTIRRTVSAVNTFMQTFRSR